MDDVYGHAVADGARAELRDRGLEASADVAYDPRRYDPAKVVAEVAAARPDVLFVVAYLEDGVALRREQVRQHLPLLASIGTSSSYCMPEFGALLGRDAVGLFASDKPDTHGINPSGLAPDARALLDRADAAYQKANGLDERRRPGRLLRRLGPVPPRAPGGRLARPADVAAAARGPGAGRRPAQRQRPRVRPAGERRRRRQPPRGQRHLGVDRGQPARGDLAAPVRHRPIATIRPTQ